jgi:hypothetical protein
MTCELRRKKSQPTQTGERHQHAKNSRQKIDAPDSGLPRTDDELVEELTRAFLSYLGAAYEGRPW